MFSLKHSGKKGLLVITLASLLMLFTEAQANPRYAAIVVDATTGTVLHEENADEERYIASLTKMMTLTCSSKPLNRNEQVLILVCVYQPLLLLCHLPI